MRMQNDSGISVHKASTIVRAVVGPFGLRPRREERLRVVGPVTDETVATYAAMQEINGEIESWKVES